MQDDILLKYEIRKSNKEKTEVIILGNLMI